MPVALATPHGGFKLRYEEDFEGYSVGPWPAPGYTITGTGITFNISTGQHFTGDSTANNSKGFAPTDIRINNGKIRAKIRRDSNALQLRQMLELRADLAGSYVGAALLPSGGLIIQQRLAAPTTTLATDATATYPANTWFTLECEVHGDQVWARKFDEAGTTLLNEIQATHARPFSNDYAAVVIVENDFTDGGTVDVDDLEILQSPLKQTT